MRIQETDRILKEARYARHNHERRQRSRGGLWRRAWRSVTSFFKRSQSMAGTVTPRSGG